jgi:hypothetical protein
MCASFAAYHGSIIAEYSTVQPLLFSNDTDSDNTNVFRKHEQR